MSLKKIYKPDPDCYTCHGFGGYYDTEQQTDQWFTCECLVTVNDHATASSDHSDCTEEEFKEFDTSCKLLLDTIDNTRKTVASCIERLERSMRSIRYAERERIMRIFSECGKDAIENGKELKEYDTDLGFEARARVMAGVQMLDISQILFTEARSENFWSKANLIMRDIKEAIGEDRWEEIVRETDTILGSEDES